MCSHLVGVVSCLMLDSWSEKEEVSKIGWERPCNR